MTSRLMNLRGNFFAKSDLSELVPLADHDTLLVGDTLTTVTLNYQWRKFLVSAIDAYLDNGFSKLEDPDLIDSLNQARALMEDFYSP